MLVVTCAACCVINCAARRLRPSLTFNVTPVALAVPFLVWLSSTLCRAICRTGPFICLSSCCVRRPSHACRAVPLDVRAVCAPLVFTHLATHRMYGRDARLAIPRVHSSCCACAPVPRSMCRSYDEAIIISHQLYAVRSHWPHDLLPDCVCRHVRVAGPSGTG